MQVKSVGRSEQRPEVSRQGSSAAATSRAVEGASSITAGQTAAGRVGTVVQTSEAAVATIRSISSKPTLEKVKSYDEAASIARDVADRLREGDDNNGEPSDHHRLKGTDAKAKLA